MQKIELAERLLCTTGTRLFVSIGMSSYKVKKIVSQTPIQIFDDGGFIFNENDIVYYCYINSVVELFNCLYANSGNIRMKKINGYIYYVTSGKTFRLNTKTMEIEKYSDRAGTIVEINSVAYFQKTQEEIIDAEGNIHKVHHRFILHANNNFVISAKVIKKFERSDDCEVTLDIYIYKFGTFEELYKTNFKLYMNKTTNYMKTVNYYEEYLGIPEKMKLHIRFHGNGVIQIGGEIIKITEELPEEKPIECAICFDLLKKYVILIPCAHREFCPKCAKVLKTCPLCRAKIDSTVDVKL